MQLPTDQYVWAYEKGDCLRVISPYMGETHYGIDAARRWYADEYADDLDYLGLELYRLVPVEADPEPARARVMTDMPDDIATDQGEATTCPT